MESRCYRTTIDQNHKNGLISECLMTSITEYASKTALLDEKEVVTYSQLALKLEKFNHLLQDHGVKQGDVVGIEGTSSIDTVVALLSVVFYGAMAMPINPFLSADEIQILTTHANCKLVLTSSDSKVNMGSIRSVSVSSHQ